MAKMSPNDRALKFITRNWVSWEYSATNHLGDPSPEIVLNINLDGDGRKDSYKKLKGHREKTLLHSADFTIMEEGESVGDFVTRAHITIKGQKKCRAFMEAAEAQVNRVQLVNSKDAHKSKYIEDEEIAQKLALKVAQLKLEMAKPATPPEPLATAPDTTDAAAPTSHVAQVTARKSGGKGRIAEERRRHLDEIQPWLFPRDDDGTDRGR